MEQDGKNQLRIKNEEYQKLKIKYKNHILKIKNFNTKTKEID